MSKRRIAHRVASRQDTNIARPLGVNGRAWVPKAMPCIAQFYPIGHGQAGRRVSHESWGTSPGVRRTDANGGERRPALARCPHAYLFSTSLSATKEKTTRLTR
jgi:hypothetical protein